MLILTALVLALIRSKEWKIKRYTPSKCVLLSNLPFFQLMQSTGSNTPGGNPDPSVDPHVLSISSSCG